MVDPIITYIGKGLLRSFLFDPDGVLDLVSSNEIELLHKNVPPIKLYICARCVVLIMIKTGAQIPADMVVNAMLATIAKHGTKDVVPGMHVYHMASSVTNPLTIPEAVKYTIQHFTRSPLMDKAGNSIPVQPVEFLDSMEEFTKDADPNALLQSRGCASSSNHLLHRAPELRAIKQIINLGRIYEPYAFYGGRFDTTNTDALFAEMSMEDRTRFNFDARCVDWIDYINNVHIPGLKKHILKVGHRNQTTPATLTI